MSTIAIAALLLALLALAPAGLALRHRVTVRERGQTTVDLYRAQLLELDRDLAECRIVPTEHATAQLEIQRRLLAASETADEAKTPGDRGLLVLGMALVPMIAVALYLVSGRPELPAQPLAARQQETQEALTQLRTAVARLDPHSEQAIRGEVMLGNLEASSGHFAEAAAAWRTVLDQRFDPTLAVLVADAASRAEGHVSDTSAALFRRALAAAPPDAAWRGEVEARLAQTASPPLPGPRVMPK